MSRSADNATVPIKDGNSYPKCNKLMQRFKHSRHWKPLEGRNYFAYWDRCFYCKHFQNYAKAKVYIYAGKQS